MKPLGGGDPIPLFKNEVIVGRRPTCDVRLDFDNVSGKHCLLRLIEGVWHVRDLGSTNGTMVNRQKIDHEHGLMPDDELGVASHLFSIDYDPVTIVKQSKEVLEAEIGRVHEARGSLMEQAGIIRDPEKRRAARLLAEKTEMSLQATGSEFSEVKALRDATVSGPKNVSDDDFFRMIEDDVKKSSR
jgi:hypothetical protein